MTKTPKKPLKYRSQNWFDNPDNADMTALYLERYLNYGFTRGELQGHKRSLASPRQAPTCHPATAPMSNW